VDPRAKWSRLSKETLQSCPYHDFCHDEYRLPDGSVGDYYYIEIPGSSMVVPVLENGELVLVRQHRYLHGRSSLELPAGGIKRGRDPLATARDELREEAGYEALSIVSIGSFAPCNGLSNELCHVFLASDLSPVPPAPEPTEELERLTLPLDELDRLVGTGELWDGMTIVALKLYQSWIARLDS
jgi:ADP-ribose pyrophosphatase